MLGVDFEDVVAHLEADGFHLGRDVLAAVLHVAEGLITGAVKVGQGLLPLLSDLFENIRRNGQLGATGVDDGRVRGVFSGLLHRHVSVEHALALESPSTEPVLEVLESLEALSAADDLCRVVATEEGIGSLVHLLGSDTERNHSSVDDAVLSQRPQVVKLSLLHVLVGRQTEDTIGVVAETLRLVEGKELEESALVVLDLGIELSRVLGINVEGLDASVVLPDEALELGRTVSQLGRSLREDLVGLGLVHVVSHGLAALMRLVSGDKATGERIILLKLVVAGEIVITENTGDSEVLGASVEDNSGGLTLRSAHVHGTKVNGIVSAVERNLQLQVVLVIDGRVGDLADELLLMNARVSGLLILGLEHFSLNIRRFVILILRVQTARALLLGLGKLVALSLLDIELCLSSLQLSQLRVVQLIAIDHDGLLLVDSRVRRAINDEVDVGSFFQLDVVVVVHNFALEVNSENLAAGLNVQGVNLQGAARVQSCHGQQTHLEEAFGHFV